MMNVRLKFVAKSSLRFPSRCDLILVSRRSYIVLTRRWFVALVQAKQKLDGFTTDQIVWQFSHSFELNHLIRHRAKLLGFVDASAV